MEIVKIGETEVKFPTIVKVKNDYYVLSKPSDINDNLEIPSGSRIAINLKDGRWFDWGNEFPVLETQMQSFDKGTKFEIEI